MLTWTSLQSKCFHSRKRFKNEIQKHLSTSKQQCVDLLHKNDGFKIALTVHQPENLTLVQTVQFRLIKTFLVFFFFFWSQIFFVVVVIFGHFEILHVFNINTFNGIIGRTKWDEVFRDCSTWRARLPYRDQYYFLICFFFCYCYHCYDSS